MYSISAATSRKLIGTATSPARATPMYISIHSRQLYARSATRSPLRSPRPSNALPRRFARSSHCANVTARRESRAPTLSGARRACAATTCATLRSMAASLGAACAFGVVPGGERLELRHPAQSLARVRRQRVLGDDDIEQG